MNAIKVGDKVRIIKLGLYREASHQGLFVGNTGTVAHIHANGSYAVRTDNAQQPADSGGIGWTFYHKELKLVVEDA